MENKDFPDQNRWFPNLPRELEQQIEFHARYARLERYRTKQQEKNRNATYLQQFRSRPSSNDS
jgi:hypothetical protein